MSDSPYGMESYPDRPEIPPADMEPPPVLDEGFPAGLGAEEGELSSEEAEVLSSMSMFEVADLTEAPPLPPRGVSEERVLKGRVFQVHGDDVFIDMGGKAEGVVPRRQFGNGDEPVIGREIEVVFDHFDEGSQIQVFSRPGVVRAARWESLAPGIVVEGRITGMNKGGLEVNLKGIRGFMPASHVDIDRIKDISVLIGQTIACEVLEVDRRGKNVLVSRRKVQEKEHQAAREALWAELKEGHVRKGVVRNLAEYGAFVDLGGVDGLLHISDMSWSQVAKPGDVVSIGQEVEVMVLKVDRQRERVSLGLKQARPDPWSAAATKYAPGTQLKVRVTRLAEFGAFAEVEDGIEALIPLSEMSWERVNKPQQAVGVGQVVDAAVIRVEVERHRMALSMKQAEPDPWADVATDFPKDSVATGIVSNVVPFGVFVRLRPGVEGLVHISELSGQRVRSPSDVVRLGETVSVKVLEVDATQRKIALSVKAAIAPPSLLSTEAQLKEQSKAPRGPRRVRRGGLSSTGGGLFDGILK